MTKEFQNQSRWLSLSLLLLVILSLNCSRVQYAVAIVVGVSSITTIHYSSHHSEPTKVDAARQAY
jgi:transcription initiation factor TFIIIB Brf1 subunit/transcription initiation factor TFIIB